MIIFHGELEKGQYKGEFNAEGHILPVNTDKTKRFYNFLREWNGHEPNKDELKLFIVMVEEKFND